MNQFSPSEAGLEGFRVARENRRAFGLWVLFSFAVSLLGALVTVSMPAEVRTAMETLQSDTTPDARTFLHAMIAMAPLLVFGLAIQCVMAAAVYRIILRHDDTRWGYLRLGRDELRLMALTLIYLGLAIAGLVGVTIAAALLAAIAGMGGQAVGAFVGVAAELFAIGLVIYVAVRLSLAPVITFAERRFAIFDSWPLTRGAFWRLLGAYVLALFCMIVVTIVTLVLFTALAGILVLVTGGQMEDVSRMFDPDQTSLAAYFNPLMLAYMLVGSLITALYYAVIAAPGAWVYQRLHGDVPVAPLSTPAHHG